MRINLHTSLWLIALVHLAGYGYPLTARGESAEGDTAEASPVAATAREEEAWQAEHRRLNALSGRDTARLVLLGDDAVAGMQAAGEEAWNAFLADHEAINLGVAGDCAEHLLWRVENGNLDGCHPRLVVIHAGASDLAADDSRVPATANEIGTLVDKVQESLPESKILVLGVFSPVPKPSSEQQLVVARLNRLLSNLADWEQVHFLDVGCALGDADQSIPAKRMSADGSLTAAGYRCWVEAMDFKIAELLGESSDKRVELFDGQSLSGWQAGDEEGQPQGWNVDNGQLKVVGKGTDAQTDRLFGDFDFQCEWKVEARSNSGIFYRWADYGGIVSAGPEYQVVDDVGRNLPPDLDSSTAATTDMYGPPSDKPVRPAGEWNHTRIVAVDGEVEHWLNGIRVLSFDMASKDWRRRLADSKFSRLWPFGRIYEGAFRLQNYGGLPAVYRDITVVEL